jgi:hypothetical protein
MFHHSMRLERICFSDLLEYMLHNVIYLQELVNDLLIERYDLLEMFTRIYTKTYLLKFTPSNIYENVQ